jgi:glycosyltransferase involved in cell wall biosynthesis
LRTLFVAPRVPFPLDIGGNQRMFHVLSALARLGPVDLVCLAHPRFTPEERELKPLRDLCDTLEMIPHDGSRWPDGIQSYRDAVERMVLARRPRQIAEFRGEVLAERVAALAPRADLIWAVRLYVAEWLTTGRERTIVDVDDLESVKESRRLGLEPLGRWQALARFDNAKLRRLERRAAGRYAGVVVCSEGDRRFFPARHRDRALVVPNGIPGQLLATPPSPREPASLVMVGAMRYGPNADAALWFAREILPRVAAAMPDVRLYLVGDDRRGVLRSVHDGQRVIATGRVDDVAPYVSRAAVSLAPLRFGGGTRIKILEALALGTPVVSTTVGADGLDLVPGRHLAIGDTPDAFAGEVIRLLRDPAARQALAEAGRARVAQRYTWESIGEALGGDVRRLASRWRPSPPVVAGRGGRS